MLLLFSSLEWTAFRYAAKELPAGRSCNGDEAPVHGDELDALAIRLAA